MLAATETDLEMQRSPGSFGIAEQQCRCDRPFGRNRDLRQKRVDQILLPRAQGLALRAPVKAVERRRIAGFISRHAARVSRGAAPRQDGP
jgi:hypothetical protein